jgi:hypothetical protein
VRIQAIDVNVTVANKSSKTLYVVSKVIQTIYDPTTKTLILNLSTIGETHPRKIDLAPRVIHKRTPPTIEVKPNQSETIRLLVPIKINRIVGFEKGKIKFETSDISDLEHVTVKVGFGETPFSILEGPATVGEITKRFQTWGETIKMTFDAVIPGKGETKKNIEEEEV